MPTATTSPKLMRRVAVFDTTHVRSELDVVIHGPPVPPSSTARAAPCCPGLIDAHTHTMSDRGPPSRPPATTRLARPQTGSRVAATQPADPIRCPHARRHVDDLVDGLQAL